MILAGGASSGPRPARTRSSFDNAFGLVTGADFKVAGVPAGTICADQPGTPGRCKAVVTVRSTKSGFGQFHADANCESRPESLIGEYYIDCNPGTSGPVLKAGSTIPVSHTPSTIPADLLQDVMRLPYRQRFSLIVNELGAAAAARSGDLQAALQRAVPALTETDNLLNLLANDSRTLQRLTADSNSVITALANNSKNVKRFIDEANRTARATATQQGNLRTHAGSLARDAGAARPTLAQLRTTVTTNQPVLPNLNQASGQLNRLFTDLPAFSRSASPAIKSLGQASVTGKHGGDGGSATVADLNTLRQADAGAGQNLAIVLHDLDNPSRAVEPDPRSPGGKGFTGLQALLWLRVQPDLAINTFGRWGHMLAVDAFFSPMCSPYATPAYIAMVLKQYGSAYRSCYSWLGPNQPGVNETDPSNPSAAVPDPGRSTARQDGPKTSAARLTSSMVQAAQVARRSNTARRRGPIGWLGLAAVPPGRARTTAPDRHGGLGAHDSGLRQLVEQLKTSPRPDPTPGPWAASASSAAPSADRASSRRPGQPDPATPQLPARAMSTTRQSKRTSRPSALANPVLVGAVTVLVIMVAMFLAYNAKEGLPFVPTELKVDVASGSDLVPGNEVREGGFQVGIVKSMVPISCANGQVAGQLTLQLDQPYGRVPVDSTAWVRPLSVFGLKYVDLHVGGSHRVFPDGAMMPIRQTRCRSSSRTSFRRSTRRPGARSIRVWWVSATHWRGGRRSSTTRSRACRGCSGICGRWRGIWRRRRRS